jgi:hypothetical protein
LRPKGQLEHNMRRFPEAFAAQAEAEAEAEAEA